MASLEIAFAGRHSSKKARSGHGEAILLLFCVQRTGEALAFMKRFFDWMIGRKGICRLCGRSTAGSRLSRTCDECLEFLNEW